MWSWISDGAAKRKRVGSMRKGCGYAVNGSLPVVTSVLCVADSEWIGGHHLPAGEAEDVGSAAAAEELDVDALLTRIDPP